MHSATVGNQQQERHDGLVSLHRLIRKSLQAKHYNTWAIGLKHWTGFKKKKKTTLDLMFSNKQISKSFSI